ncbi:MAG: M56 family metallopeptidase [Actinobacteria bacterium]|nr:M56 family metallopeptidase [Actinomycetota bacterium]
MPGHLVQPLLAAALLALASTALHRRLPPRLASNHIAAVMVILVIAAVPTVVLVSLTYLAHVPFFGSTLQWCSHALGHHREVPVWLGVTCTVLLAAGTVRCVRVVSSYRRMSCSRPAPLAVADDDTPFAITLPGPGGRIVVSAGLIQALDPHETEVVIAHEQAHAALRHDRYLLLGALVTAFLPPLAWLSSRLTFSLERWADETAADRCGDRRLVAATLGKVALIDRTDRPPMVGFAGAAGFAGLGVAARVRLLLRPPVPNPDEKWVVALAVTVGAAAAFAAFQVHHVEPLIHFLCH